MTPTDKQLVPAGPWPRGINNLEPEDSLPVDENGNQTSLRHAVNVDVTRQGKVSRREGYEVVAEGNGQACYGAPMGMLVAIDGDLKLFDGNLGATTLIADIGDYPMSFETVNGEVLWTNTQQIVRIDADGNVKPVWIDAPGQPDVSAYATGGLPAGDYQVAIGWRDSQGRESGSSLATVVRLTKGQGIRLSNVPQNPDAAEVMVFCTTPNGDALYWAGDFPAGNSTYIFGNGPRKKLMETQWLQPLPPGQCIRFVNGVALVASGNLVWRSEPRRYGLCQYDSFVRYSGYVSLMQPVGAADVFGVFVAVNDERAGKSRTYFIAGNDVATWKQIPAYPHGAIEGTCHFVPGDESGIEEFSAFERVAVWVADNGMPVAGAPTGVIRPLTAGRFVTDRADSGAGMFRKRNGIAQTIFSLIGAQANEAAVSDFPVAEVRRNGVVL